MSTAAEEAVAATALKKNTIKFTALANIRKLITFTILHVLLTTISIHKVSGSQGVGKQLQHSSSSQHYAWLGEFCEKNSDCEPQLSECNPLTNVCTCQPYSVEANSTMCLPGTLLGFRCETDAQCGIKVPNSGCINGICACGSNFVAHRRHTCLPPAQLDQICMENEQCTLGDKGSYCKFVIPRAYGRCQCEVGRERNLTTNKCSPKLIKLGELCSEDNECTMDNGFCQPKLDGHSYCTCDVGYTPSINRSKCVPTYRGLMSATSLGYPCHAHLECQLNDPNSICSPAGICDCAVVNMNSTRSCSAKNTGCHKQTFQCHSDGKCISWYFVCDGTIDCSDGSDEICEFTNEGECPSQAFQCGNGKPAEEVNYDETLAVKIGHANNGSGSVAARKEPSLTGNALASSSSTTEEKVTCISRSKICDKVPNCPDGSDELNCQEINGNCPLGTFSCASTKECLPEYQFCNAIADCFDVSDEDELKCRTEFQPADYCPFRCDNGLCRSTAILCSDVDGCGDNSDEKNCRVCRKFSFQYEYCSKHPCTRLSNNNLELS